MVKKKNPHHSRGRGVNKVIRGLDRRGRQNKFGQGEKTMGEGETEGGREANKRGGGRWESSKEEMGCDEWRETGRKLEKIGFQGAGRERSGCCKPAASRPSKTLTSSESSGQMNTMS